MQNDLEIIHGLAELSERHSPEARRIGLTAMIDDYSRMLIQELDYEREARSTERARANFANDPRVVIPKVFWEYSTRYILTEEYIEGLSSAYGEISRRGWDRINSPGWERKPFVPDNPARFFQADPHRAIFWFWTKTDGAYRLWRGGYPY